MHLSVCKLIANLAFGLFAGLFLILTVEPVFAQSSEDAPCTLRFGVVPQFEQRRLTAVWKPLANAISLKTTCKVKLHGSNSIPEFEEEFKAGLFDIAYMNPYHAVMAHDAQGYEPIVRSDESRLKGILVVRKDDPIQSITDLHGKEVAFPSPNALGASLLMRTELAELHGVRVVPKYVSTHSSTYIHVVKNLVAAGGGVARTLREQPDGIKDALRILYTTSEVFAHPIVVHPRLAPELRESIQTTLLELAEGSPELFESIPMKRPTASNFADYEGLSAMGLEAYME